MTGITIHAADRDRLVIERTLHKLGPEIQRCLATTNLVVRALAPGERFADVARKYRTADTLDYGICQGLYDPHRSVVVLRLVRDDIVAHELLHGVDHVLGSNDHPRSLLDDTIAAAFRRHRRDGCAISSYSLVNRLEFVAEHLKGACGFSSPRPASRKSDFERLQLIDPTLAATMQSWIAEVRTAYR